MSKLILKEIINNELIETEVIYYERPGSPSESYSGDTFRAKRIFDVPWNQRWMFIKHMLGTARLVENNEKIERDLPDQYFIYYKGTTQGLVGTPKAFMVAVGLENIECIGQQRVFPEANTYVKIQSCGYDFARITINYESVTYRVTPWSPTGSQYVEQQPDEYKLSRYTTVFRQPSAEFLSLPFGAYRWVEYDAAGNVIIDSKTKNPSGVQVTGAQGKIVAASEVVLIHHKVPGIPKAIKTHIGCVNRFDWPQMGAKKGQLLLTNVELKPFRWLEDNRLYDITFKMKFFDPDPLLYKTEEPLDEPRGHNWFLQHFPVTKNTNLDAPGAVAKVLAGTQKYKLITHNGYPPVEVNQQIDPKIAGQTVYKYADFAELFKNYETPTEEQNTWMT